MSASTYGFGQYAASEAHQFWRNRDYKADASKRVVIFDHGAGGSYAIGPHEKMMVAKGIPIMACDLGGAQTWGNDTSLTRIQDAWTYAKNNLGVATDKYGLWGGSMGTLTALLGLLADPTHVSVCAGALPIVDPEQVRSEDAGGFQSEIEAALGAGTVTSAKRPNQNTADFISAAVPIKLWISETDTVGDADLAHDFVSDINAQEASLGSVGHSYLSMDNDSAYAFVGSHLNA